MEDRRSGKLKPKTQHVTCASGDARTLLKALIMVETHNGPGNGEREREATSDKGI